MLKTIIKSIKTFPATTFIFNHFIQTISSLKAREVSEKYTLNSKRESITSHTLFPYPIWYFALSLYQSFGCSRYSLSGLSFSSRAKNASQEKHKEKKTYLLYGKTLSQNKSSAFTLFYVTIGWHRHFSDS